MINESIFREYDIRGIVPDELNEKSIKLIGYYLGLEIVKKYKIKNSNNSASTPLIAPYIAIGYDARHSCEDIFNYLTSGLNKANCKVFNMGMVATGVNYFSSYQKFNNINPFASIMITGSHNPSNYNGLKITVDKKPFFSNDIYKLGQKIASSNIIIKNDLTHTKIDVKSLYIDYILKEFSHLKSMKTKFVIDCGNGVANSVLCTILDKLDLNYEGLYLEPDGSFPNHHPDPSEEKNLIEVKKYLQEDDIKYAFAYDGDADRIAFLTKKYNIKGDILALLLTKKIKNPIVIGEVKCSQIMYDEINKAGGKAIMYKTGHSNLKVKIKETNAHLGAEVSGHLFFNDRYFGYDDAIYATFRILELINDNINIDKQIEALPSIYSSQEIKVSTTEEKKFLLISKIEDIIKTTPPKNLPKIKNIITIDGLRIIFEDGWALVRASNTTPVLVTRFESIKKDNLKLYEKSLNDIIKEAKKIL